jgi:hypothetical protein
VQSVTSTADIAVASGQHLLLLLLLLLSTSTVTTAHADLA